MSENYNIIEDPDILLNFIDWLPELGPNQKYYVALFARKKYDTEGILKADKAGLKRFTATKVNLFRKIQQLEVPYGCYQIGDQTVPQQALALYITVNPRDMKRATSMLGKKCWDLAASENYNIHQEAMSCIQKSKAATHYVDFDIDSKDVDLNILEDLIPGAYQVVETKGGYHVLVSPIKARACAGPKWFSNIVSAYGDKVDQVGDQLLPVPGTHQGGFTPKFKY